MTVARQSMFFFRVKDGISRVSLNFEQLNSLVGLDKCEDSSD